MPMRMIRRLLVLAAILGRSSMIQAYTIRVCQNKHCCKRNPNLLQTVHDLVGTSGSVEASGCLSHCDHGPNMEVDIGNAEAQVLNGIEDSTMAIVSLERALDTSIPKLLAAAVKVMERSTQSTDPSEQERFLSSVINKLELSDHAHSSAISRAYALRSNAYLEQSEWSSAIDDARKAVTLADVASPKTLSLAYRSWVDALEGQKSHPKDVISVLQAWFKAQPEYRTKLKREIVDLVQRSQT